MPARIGYRTAELGESGPRRARRGPGQGAGNVTNRTIHGYIGESLRVRGQLTGSGDMVIDGRFDGDIDVDGTIEVGPTGLLDSPTRADTVILRGLLEGSVHAASAVVIEAGGRLLGDVHAERVSLSDGGALEGAVIMDFDLPADFTESA